jgi:hypothetical protein
MVSEGRVIGTAESDGTAAKDVASEEGGLVATGNVLGVTG